MINMNETSKNYDIIWETKPWNLWSRQKRAKIKSKSIENLFHEIIAKFPNTEKEVDTKDE